MPKYLVGECTSFFVLLFCLSAFSFSYIYIYIYIIYIYIYFTSENWHTLSFLKHWVADVSSMLVVAFFLIGVRIIFGLRIANPGTGDIKPFRYTHVGNTDIDAHRHNIQILSFSLCLSVSLSLSIYLSIYLSLFLPPVSIHTHTHTHIHTWYFRKKLYHFIIS